MKKNSILISIIITLGLLLTTACNPGFTDDPFGAPNAQTDGKTGSATFSVVVPDYYAMSNASRAVAPQSTKIRLSYKKSSAETAQWYPVDTLNLSEAVDVNASNAATATITKTELTTTELAGATMPSGTSVPVKFYNCIFTGIPSGVYPAGWMKIEILENGDTPANPVVLSSGTNNSVVTIIMGQKSPGMFYTIPVVAEGHDLASGDQVSHTLSLWTGKMKFVKYTFDADHVSTLTISLPTGNNYNYPDLVVFKSDGTFDRYIRTTAQNHVISCAGLTGTRYCGFWFPGNANNFSYQFTHTPVTNNSTTLFNNVLADANNDGVLDSGWTITEAATNYQSTALDYYTPNDPTSGLCFNYDTNYPQNTVFSKTVAFNEAKTLSFEIEVHLVDSTDGSFEFWVDNDRKDSFTSTNFGNWVTKNYSITAGVHTIKWKKVDENASASNNSTQGAPYVGLRNLTIATATSSSGSGN